MPPGPRSWRLRRRHGAGARCSRRATPGTIAVALCLGIAAAAQAQLAAPQRTLPAISIIIDDLGYRRLDGLRAIELPGPIAYAVLPHTPYGTRLATIAFQLDKEVLLHVPMESDVDKALGPGALTNAMSREQFQSVLEAGLASVPHASGLNNHMGSALTRKSRPMGWVMEWMRKNGELYFVDSVTSAESIALRSARAAGLRAIARDVFLDPVADSAIVRRQFLRLVELARVQGTALAIGHAYPETLSVLRGVLLKPSHFGVELVSVRELIARREGASQAAASSRSRVVSLGN